MDGVGGFSNYWIALICDMLVPSCTSSPEHCSISHCSLSLCSLSNCSLSHCSLSLSLSRSAPSQSALSLSIYIAAEGDCAPALSRKGEVWEPILSVPDPRMVPGGVPLSRAAVDTLALAARSGR